MGSRCYLLWRNSNHDPQTIDACGLKNSGGLDHWNSFSLLCMQAVDREWRKEAWVLLRQHNLMVTNLNWVVICDFNEVRSPESVGTCIYSHHGLAEFYCSYK